jgi:hypothetical protein
MIASIDKFKTPQKTGPESVTNGPSTKSNKDSSVDATKQMAADEIQKQLHSKPTEIRAYNFKKVKSGDAGLSRNTETILKRFEIDGNNKWHTATLSDDGKTLVVVTGGKTALSQLFGGSSSIGRFFYKIFGWVGRLFGAPHKALANQKYTEMYNANHNENPEGFRGEPLKHLVSALSNDKYHTVAVFHKNEKTGDFEKQPVALAITDAYYNLFDSFMPMDKVPQEEIQKYKMKYKKYYSLDKIIPLTKDVKEFKDIYHQIVEGLYQAQGFDLLAVPMHMHSNPNVNSNDLNYMELPWHRILQTNSGNWKIVGDSKLIDDGELKDLMDEKARAEYKAALIDQPHQITFVRPKSEANKPIPDILSHCDAWSQMSSGGVLRTNRAEDTILIQKVKMVDSNLINNHNIEQKIAEKVTSNLTEKKSEEDKKAGLLNRLFGKKSAAPDSTKA